MSVTIPPIDSILDDVNAVSGLIVRIRENIKRIELVGDAVTVDQAKALLAEIQTEAAKIDSEFDAAVAAAKAKASARG